MYAKDGLSCRFAPVSSGSQLPGVQAGDSIDEMFEGAAEAIQLPDDEGVALPCVGQSFGQAAPVIFGTARRVMENTFTPSLLQRILLEVHILVGRRDPRVAYAHVASCRRTQRRGAVLTL